MTGTVDAAATGTLTNTATVAAPTGFTDTNSANNSATDTDTLAPQGDLSITKTDGKTVVVPGTANTYTIVVGNSGPSTAAGAAVSDGLPATLTGVTWTALYSAGSSGAASGTGAMSGVLVTLLSGGTATFTVTGTVDAAATGTLTNTATVTAPTGFTDTNSANNSATDTDTIIVNSTDLKIEKSDGVTTVFAGNGATYTYTVRVTNQGAVAAAGVSVADAWPAAFAQTGFGQPSQGSVTRGSAGNFTWAIGTLAASGVAILTVSYNVPFDTAAGTAVNRAVVTSSTLDTNVANNTATDSNVIVNNVLVAGSDGGASGVSCVSSCGGDDGKSDGKDDSKCDSTDDKSGDSSSARVYVINPCTGKVEYSFLAYTDKGYTSGVRVSVGDLNNDGTLEVVVAPGAGRTGDVKVFKLDGTPLPGFATQPFGSKYSDGIELSLGDVNGDGRDDLVACKSVGFGDVQVSLSTGTGFAAYKSFVAFPPPYKGYDGGASVAVGGINRIVVGSGVGMAPTVKTFSIAGTPTLLSQFQPTLPKDTAGVSVTTQNFTGGNVLDVVVAAGPNGDSRVSVYNGQNNSPNNTYNNLATSGRLSPAVFAAASALGASPLVDTVFMSQGNGGNGTIKKVNATTGVVDSTFVALYNGKPLVGPLRIATNLRKASV